MKKNNYNINLNPEPLQSDQINQHKDFEALLKMHAQQAPAEAPAPTARHRWLYRSLAAGAAACCIGLLAYFAFFAVDRPTSAQLQAAHFAAQPYINPPIKNVEANFASQNINASKGGVYKYDNGSKVIVPPAAFVDDNGQIVEGEVNIRYREFHDFVDFFLSGIPMEYDSAGVQYNLESAGMIEIYAEQDGKRLNISPNKKIDVELVSEINLKDKDAPLNFNIYRLDTEKRNWVYTGVDRIERIDEDKASELLSEDEVIEQNYQQEIVALAQKESAAIQEVEANTPKPAAPLRPATSNPDAHSFSFDFNETTLDYGSIVSGEKQTEIDENLAAMDELREQYKNTMWQVAPNNEDFNEEAAKSIAWEDMKIRPINKRDFELTLINGNNSMKVIVNPVLTGDDYDAAMAEFNEEFNIYETKMAERRALLERQKEEIAQRIAEERAMVQEKYEKRMADYRDRGEDHMATDLMIKQKIVNRFQVSNFGIWNCDRPLPPSIYMLKGEFKDKMESDLHQNVAFLVDKTQNTVVRFYATKGADVRFNQNSDKMMWIVTKENKIALYKKEEFKKINKKRGNHTFVMDLMDKEIKTEEDVRKILLF